MTTTAPVRDIPRTMKGIGMKLVSLDHEFPGTVVDIVEYRPHPGGGLDVVVVVDEPNAWYSGFFPVPVEVGDLRLALAVQTYPRPTRLGA